MSPSHVLSYLLYITTQIGVDSKAKMAQKLVAQLPYPLVNQHTYGKSMKIPMFITSTNQLSMAKLGIQMYSYHFVTSIPQTPASPKKHPISASLMSVPASQRRPWSPSVVPGIPGPDSERRNDSALRLPDTGCDSWSQQKDRMNHPDDTSDKYT